MRVGDGTQTGREFRTDGGAFVPRPAWCNSSWICHGQAAGFAAWRTSRIRDAAAMNKDGSDGLGVRW